MGRWPILVSHPVRPIVVAVADPSPSARAWFEDAGKDFLGEKPFGIDLASAQRIADAIDSSSAFARVSSEIPYFRGAQRAFEYVQISDQLETAGAVLWRNRGDG